MGRAGTGERPGGVGVRLARSGSGRWGPWTASGRLLAPQRGDFSVGADVSAVEGAARSAGERLAVREPRHDVERAALLLVGGNVATTAPEPGCRRARPCGERPDELMPRRSREGWAGGVPEVRCGDVTGTFPTCPFGDIDVKAAARRRQGILGFLPLWLSVTSVAVR